MTSIIWALDRLNKPWRFDDSDAPKPEQKPKSVERVVTSEELARTLRALLDRRFTLFDVWRAHDLLLRYDRQNYGKR